MVDGHERGFTTFRAALIQELISTGHHIVAAAPNTTANTRAQLNDSNVDLIDIPLERTSKSILSLLRATAALAREMHGIRPDLVLAFGPKAVVASGIAAALTNSTYVPTITGVGSVFKNGLRSPAALAMAPLLRLALNTADHIVFQNEDNRNDFRQWRILRRRQETHIVNGSGVPTETWQMEPLPPLPLRFIFVGRILNSKGIREFDRACRIVAAAHHHVQFRAIGWYEPSHPDSPDESWFDAFCSGPVSYGGLTSDVLGELRQAHVFVLPSYSEGIPRSGLEALSVGRPVITTDAPGCRELIDQHRNGLLVPIGDADSLATAMFRYLDDPLLLETHSVEGRRLAETRFSDHVIINQWNAILEQVGVTQ
ncbi:glycosyltransferase family 4 protein [Janibacter limosus]|uniref:glycosyltransferase family 4 protein n=1 Tax=Janibacter limosus TaxID=53458 RepID=UPI000A05D134|nr:glycosyltransferase family 4 protein [Janibacter limosus]